MSAGRNVRLKPGPRARASRAQHGGPALKQKILDVSLELFAERGFAHTRISDIAQRAGAEAPTIYHYFGNKQALYKAASHACFGRASTMSRTALAAHQVPAERVYDHALQTARLLIEDRVFCKLLQRQLLELDDGEEMRSFVEGSFEEGLAQFSAALEELQSVQDSGRLAVFIYCVIFGAARLAPLWDISGRVSFPESRDPHLLTERVLTLCLPDVDWTSCATEIR